MKKFEIYKITNIINQKIYIGYTSIGISNRFHKHYINALAGHDTYFYRAIRKYSIEKFKLEKIDESDNSNEILNKEKYWIEFYDSYKNGYNMTKGGDGGNIVGQLSKEKYDTYIEKIIKKTSGINNPRHSGYTDDEIIEHAFIFFVKENFNWSPSKWVEYCKPLKIPTDYSKCRFNGERFLGLKKTLCIKLKENGYDFNPEQIKYTQTKEHKEKLSLAIKNKNNNKINVNN